MPSFFLRARMKSSQVSWVVNLAIRVSFICSNVAGFAPSLFRLSDHMTACSVIRCPQCNCFANDLTRLRLVARDFCESCHSGSLGRPGPEGSSILGKMKSKKNLQQRVVVCENVATTLIGACTKVAPYHCIWYSHEHMAACMTLSEPRSSASSLTPMKPRMDPVLCCQALKSC